MGDNRSERDERITELLKRGLEAWQRDYPEAETLGGLMEVAIRRKEQWGCDQLAWDARRWGGPNNATWLSLVDTAARLHPDWIVRSEKEGLERYRPRKRSPIRTKLALVAWLAMTDPELAIRIKNSRYYAPDA